MKKPVIQADLDEITFEGRELAYGAYRIRKEYGRNLATSTLLAFGLFLTLPLLAFRTSEPRLAAHRNPRIEKQIELLSEEELEKILEEELYKQPQEPMITETAPVSSSPDMMTQIEFKIPVPDPDADPNKSITRMDSLDGKNPSDHNEVGKDDGVLADKKDPKEVIGDPDLPKDDKKTDPKDPDPFEFIDFTEMAKPVNLNEVKKMIGYPELARKANLSGSVDARVLFDETGKYQKHMILKSTNDIFKHAVEAKLPLLACTPAIAGNRPTKCWITIPFKFSLK